MSPGDKWWYCNRKFSYISIPYAIYVVYYTEVRVKPLTGHHIVGAILVINPFTIKFLYIYFSNINQASTFLNALLVPQLTA